MKTVRYDLVDRRYALRLVFPPMTGDARQRVKVSSFATVADNEDPASNLSVEWTDMSMA